jgi:D-sedoheptulose 7-phosphate isomerase
MMQSIHEEFRDHLAAMQATLSECSQVIEDVAGAMIQCFREGGKLLICGNGGSAADAQHVAGEFVNRFRFDRPALPAVALTTDTSILTCVGNDSDFEFVFSRQVEALVRAGDMVVGISTSGRSKNVLRALEAGRARKAITVAFTGHRGRDIMSPLCNHCLAIPTADTPRIQEAHEFVWHVLCGEVESRLFGRS